MFFGCLFKFFINVHISVQLDEVGWGLWLRLVGMRFIVINIILDAIEFSKPTTLRMPDSE
jgi:hypothetical protein